MPNHVHGVVIIDKTDGGDGDGDGRDVINHVSTIYANQGLKCDI